jgi:hypothetical protein
MKNSGGGKLEFRKHLPLSFNRSCPKPDIKNYSYTHLKEADLASSFQISSKLLALVIIFVNAESFPFLSITKPIDAS